MMSWPSSQAVIFRETSSHSFPRKSLLPRPAPIPAEHYDDCCSATDPPSPPPTSSSPSLYATLKVLQLVNSFCRRVKTRVSSQRRPRPAKKEGTKQPQDDFCQEFERQAFDQIDGYLGRKSHRPTKKQCRPSNKPAAATVNESIDRVPAKSIKRLLRQVTPSLHNDEHSLHAIAKSNRLFLRRTGSPKLKPLSLKQLQRQLIVVVNLLNTVKRASPKQTLGNGNEIVDVVLDETYTANLEHLLLCLQDQLLRLLVAKCVKIIEEHVSECQKDQGKHRDDFFFEFPDARRPLSTTWPWSIRPSLAVLWGVCWMFYDSTVEFDQSQQWFWDSHGNMVNESGGIIVPAHAVQSYAQAMRQGQRTPGYYQGNNTQHPARQQQQRPRTTMAFVHRGDMGAERRRNAGSPMSAGGRRQDLAAPRMANEISATPSSSSPEQRQRSSESDQAALAHAFAADADRSLARHATYTTPHAAAAPPAAYSGSVGAGIHVTPPTDTWLQVPEDFAFPSTSGFDPASALVADWTAAGFATHDAQVEQQTAYNSFQPGLPLQRQQRARPSHLLPAPPPSIRVTTDLQALNTNFGPSQPQDNISPASSASSYTPHPHYHHQRDATYYPGTYLSPVDARTMASGVVEEANMAAQHHAPPSPQSNHDHHSPQYEIPPPSMTDPALMPPRKRSWDQYAQDQQVEAQNGQRSRANSNASGDHSATSPGQDGYSPRNMPRTIKRGDPPVNHENKYVCDFSPDCQGQTFDRKCEWSKHMDKHDRPYRCQHPQCAKLQGFTYSGGLLRHEREVHGKHGGPKAQLMCPYDDCKRHTGKGFTRKENLNEHVRRVHSNKDDGSQVMVPKPEGTDVAPGAITEDLDTPASAIAPELQGLEEQLASSKRRRIDTNGTAHSASPDVEELKVQLFRLRDDNAQKDAIIRRMQENEMQHQENFRQLQETLRLMQQARQAEQAQQINQAEEQQQAAQ